MDFILIPLVAFGASLLTFLSGFGLGTLLTPAFVLFFPVDVAIAQTAVVHFLNNLFKLGLVGRKADRATVVRFGLPALVASIVGALALGWLSNGAPLLTYSAFGRELQVIPIKLVIAVLLAVFTLFEVIPRLKELRIDPKYLPIGGVLSGFTGGLSGQQGALRSAFLIKLGLARDAFIGSGVVIACLIDVARLPVYWTRLSAADIGPHTSLIVAATVAAFAGASLGNRLLQKVTMSVVQSLVTVMLLLVAVGLGAGLL